MYFTYETVASLRDVIAGGLYLKFLCSWPPRTPKFIPFKNQHCSNQKTLVEVPQLFGLPKLFDFLVCEGFHLPDNGHGVLCG